MKKDILAKAIRLADKSPARPEKVVVANPKAIKAIPETLSHRLYTRITPSEFKRLTRIHGTTTPVSELLRDLLLDYLQHKDNDQPRKKR